MASAVATQAVEVNGLVEAPPTRIVDRVAGFVGDLADPKALPAIPKHLGHERHAAQAGLLVQGCEDFFFGSNFDPVSRAEFRQDDRTEEGAQCRIRFNGAVRRYESYYAVPARVHL